MPEAKERRSRSSSSTGIWTSPELMDEGGDTSELDNGTLRTQISPRLPRLSRRSTSSRKAQGGGPPSVLAPSMDQQVEQTLSPHLREV